MSGSASCLTMTSAPETPTETRPTPRGDCSMRARHSSTSPARTLGPGASSPAAVRGSTASAKRARPPPDGIATSFTLYAPMSTPTHARAPAASRIMRASRGSGLGPGRADGRERGGGARGERRQRLRRQQLVRELVHVVGIVEEPEVIAAIGAAQIDTTPGDHAQSEDVLVQVLLDPVGEPDVPLAHEEQAGVGIVEREPALEPDPVVLVARLAVILLGDDHERRWPSVVRRLDHDVVVE